jgi:peptidyl-prolyl cis-trans isomerase SurA
MLRNKMLLALLFSMASLALVQAEELKAAAAKSLEIDRIVVVVNDDVITRHELDERLNTIRQQLKKQGTALPAPEELEKQVLERMIMDMLQLQFARETGVRVDDSQLDKALGRIAQQNNFASLSEFRAKLDKDGVNFRKFREEIRSEIIAARLREREVESRLVVSDNEIDNYLLTQSKQAGKGEELELAHILVLVPEQASADKIQASKQRAEQALAQLKSGNKFAQVAAGFSDAQDAMQGGNIGWRAADRIPAIFLEALQKMQPGETSPILRSPNAFHIIKLLNRRSKNEQVVITQTHARHILIKTSELVSENEAKSRLAEIRKRIEGGASFAEQAKLHSEDGSAAQGGDLGWASPGVFVPEFEKAMNALQPGQMSGLVQSEFGWHLIQVTERRNADVSAEQKRQRASAAIRSFKADEAYQDWLRQLRDRAFVEYRSPQAN